MLWPASIGLAIGACVYLCVMGCVCYRFKLWQKRFVCFLFFVFLFVQNTHMDTHMEKHTYTYGYIEKGEEKVGQKMQEIKEKGRKEKQKNIDSFYSNHNVKQDQHAKLDKLMQNFMKSDSNIIGGNKEYQRSMELLDTIQNDVTFGNNSYDECNENDANVYGLFNEMLINRMNEPHNEILRKLNRVNMIDQEWEERDKQMAAKIKEINNDIGDDEELFDPVQTQSEKIKKINDDISEMNCEMQTKYTIQNDTDSDEDMLDTAAETGGVACFFFFLQPFNHPRVFMFLLRKIAIQ